MKDATVELAEAKAEIERLRLLMGKPHPYEIEDWEAEEYSSSLDGTEWAVFAKGSTNPLAYGDEEEMKRLAAWHNAALAIRDKRIAELEGGAS